MSIISRLRALLPGSKGAAAETSDEALVQTLRRLARAKIVQSNTKTLFFGVIIITAVFNSSIGALLESSDTDHVALIEVKGAIMEGTPTGDGQLIVKALDQAIGDEHARAIVVAANSGGGSPTHAEIVYNRLMEYRAIPIEERKPVIVSIGDACASACYWMASAADEIYANTTSIVGSIGVRMDAWGFNEALEKVGVEKRILGMGQYKTILDPYLPYDTEEKEIVTREMMLPLYNIFIDAVDASRGDKIEDRDTVYSSLFWPGKTAKELGLVDTIGSIVDVEARLASDYGVETIEMRQYNRKRMKLSGLFETSMEMAGRALIRGMTTEMAAQAASSVPTIH
ncbi:S49 family peptidase [Neiella sp. HB171785]|uniref:S49 family peptidase n=1 Tax=Neiella litorisoli TaxID=2771431 RepID=A0A8J6QIR1_9GAMM|nr:S49 family peptidase [Neiella litorisoli]MBD1389483.1 S49 family peptidase [Neiella litorisoli]